MSADLTTAATPASSTPSAGSTTSTTTTTESTPSTRDIAAQLVSDSGSDESTDTREAAPVTTPKEQTEHDSDDFDAVPESSVDAIGRTRPTSIPHPRVKQMIERRERKLIASVAKELGITKAEAELKLDDVIGSIKDRGTKFSDYEGRLKNMDTVEAMIANEPDRFMQMLVEIDPRYAAYAKQQPQQPGPKVDDDPEPQPDINLGDGRMTYSLDGLNKRDAWKERQILKRLDGQLSDRLKPFEEEARQKKEREAHEKAHAEMSKQVTNRLERARKWPQFTEHEAEILKALQDDTAKTLSLEDAYMQVVVPKLAGDRTKLRQEVLAEINAQPKSSSVATTTTPKAPDKPKTTADIAREVMSQLGG